MIKLVLYKCPVCGADNNQPCRTPKGRKKKNIHDTRPFGIDIGTPTPQGASNEKSGS